MERACDARIGLIELGVGLRPVRKLADCLLDDAPVTGLEQRERKRFCVKSERLKRRRMAPALTL